MKNVLVAVKNGIIQIKNFAEEYPKEADRLELFTFTEKPEDIQDLLIDLEVAIGKVGKA